jgi:glycosyltransferase involved in cell wall biosynthesis
LNLRLISKRSKGSLLELVRGGYGDLPREMEWGSLRPRRRFGTAGREPGIGTMRIAIIIPCYNRERFLSMCLDSALRQTRPADEILVVDDGSTDGSAAVCRRYPTVRYLRQENGGPSSARNFGLKHTRADAILFLDSDDILADNALALLSEGLAACPDVAAVFGRPILFRGDGFPRETDRDTWPKPEEIRALILDGPVPGVARISRKIGLRLLRNGIVLQGSALVRRSVLEAVGPWDESLHSAEDQDLWLRITAKQSLAYRDETVMFYRRHEASLTDSEHWIQFQTNILRVLHKTLHSDWADPQLKKKAGTQFAKKASKMSRLYAAQGDAAQAVQWMWSSLKHRPFHWTNWIRMAWYAARGRAGRTNRRGASSPPP